MESSLFAKAFAIALDRLGLHIDDLPGLALRGGTEEQLLAHVDSLPTGSTWHQIFPELPSDWIPGQALPLGPGKPYGDFDYPDPPRGAAITAIVEQGSSEQALSALVAAAQQFPLVYGAGVSQRGAIGIVVNVILRLTASDEDVWFVAEWLEAHPLVSGIAIGRLGPNNTAT